MTTGEMLSREQNLREDLNSRHEKRLTLPLWLEVALCVLPLVIANIWIQHVVLEKNINKSEVGQYRVIMENIVNAFGARLKYSQSTQIDIEDILETRDSMVVPVSEQDVAEDCRDASGNSAGTIYYRVYIDAGDEVLLRYDPKTGSIMYSDEMYEQEVEAVRRAEASDGVIFDSRRHDGVEYLSAYLALDTDGKEVSYSGMMLTGDKNEKPRVIFRCFVDEDAIRDTQHRSVMRTTFMLSAGLGAMMVILAILLRRELSSLRLMRATMERITEEESGGTADSEEETFIGRSPRRSEITDLINVFNRMAGNIKVSLRRTRRLTDMFEPFVPEKLLNMLGKADIRDVKPGDSMEITGDLAYIRFKDAIEESHRIVLMNELSETLMEPLARDGGMILNFDSNSMIILFPGDGGMKNTSDAYNEWVAGRKEDPGCVLCSEHRTLEVRLIGNESRMQLYIGEKDLKTVREQFHAMI